MRLFEIDNAVERFMIENIDPETGEISDAALLELERLELERDRKALAVAAYILGARAEAKAIQEQGKILLDRAQIHFNQAERLEGYLEQHIEAGKKLSDARVSISWRKSVRVELDENAIEKLEERFCRVRVEPDKLALKDALQKGETIDGAQLVERRSIVVR